MSYEFYAAQRWLTAAGILSLAAALLHVACIFGGPQWYRFFGAGERMAREAARGSPMPVVITMAIAAVLAIWAAYAFSAAGLIPRLPLLRTALVTIGTIYLVRGLVLIPMFALKPALVSPFWIWSSLIVLVYGLVYAVGTAMAWPELSAG